MNAFQKGDTDSVGDTAMDLSKKSKHKEKHGDNDNVHLENQEVNEEQQTCTTKTPQDTAAQVLINKDLYYFLNLFCFSPRIILITGPAPLVQKSM